MKWFKVGSVERREDGQYQIQHAAGDFWVAYKQTREGWEKIGEFTENSVARAACAEDSNARA